jgi:hypothetical protein
VSHASGAPKTVRFWDIPPGTQPRKLNRERGTRETRRILPVAPLTNKDSIERSAPQMIGYNQDVIARSLDAIAGWTSPGDLPCLLLFIPRGSNRLRRVTMQPNLVTEPSMAIAGRTVQSAFYGRNSHATRQSSPTPCREAAQSNFCCSECAGRVSVSIRSSRRRIAERFR